MKITNNDSRLNKKIVVNDSSNITAEHELGSVIVMEKFIPQNLIDDLSRLKRIDSKDAPKSVKKASGSPIPAIQHLAQSQEDAEVTYKACIEVLNRVLSFVKTKFEEYLYNIQQ